MKLNSNIESRNIFIFSIGSLISGLGTMLYNFSIGLYVLKLTGSSLNFSITILLSMLPKIILFPIAGILADKHSRKTTIVVMDVLSFILLLTIYIAVSKNNLTLLFIYLTSILLSSFNAFFSVNIESCIPNLVSKNKIIKINSINSMINSIVRISGPILSGIAYSIFEIKYIILINAISFLISAIFELFLIIKNSDIKSSIHSSFISNIKFSLLYIKKNKLIYLIIKYSMLINFLTLNILIAIPYYCINVIKISSSLYGIIQIALPLGMICSSFLFTTTKNKKINILKQMFIILLLIAFSHFILFIILKIELIIKMKLILLFICIFIIGFLLCNIEIPINANLQNLFDDNIRGRLNGILSSLSQILSPISIFFFGFLVDKFYVSYTILIAGAAFLILSFLLFRDINKKTKVTL
ncbi:MAG: MFS transporter [Spirochaetia bacterium]|nr:MFS transporter [Spirochaetia bacterium]